ncbi:MAG: hypothetical protein R3F58_09365 [Steroidobacteraceae bacterium]
MSADVYGQLHYAKSVLVSAVEAAGARAVSFLSVSNGGAAVALLAFLGASAELRTYALPWSALGLFTLGFVLCGITIALGYTAAYRNGMAFAEDLKNAGELDEVKVIEVIRRVGTRNRRLGAWAHGCGWASLVAFVIGVVVAAYWLSQQWRPYSPRRTVTAAVILQPALEREAQAASASRWRPRETT